MEKVFCIGTWKTGTTSVGRACNYLVGGNHDGNTSTSLDREKHLNSVFNTKTNEDSVKAINNLIEGYSTFDDAPWNRGEMISLLSNNFTQHKYILTTRDPDEWHYSAYSFYRKRTEENKLNPYLIWLLYSKEFIWTFGESINQINLSEIVNDDYRGMIKKKSLWIDWYNKRNEKVKSLFKDNLLTLDVTHGLHWEPICKFLNKDVPGIEFPKLNVQAS